MHRSMVASIRLPEAESGNGSEVRRHMCSWWVLMEPVWPVSEVVWFF